MPEKPDLILLSKAEVRWWQAFNAQYEKEQAEWGAEVEKTHGVTLVKSKDTYVPGNYIFNIDQMALSKIPAPAQANGSADKPEPVEAKA
jgi:hypothetical protein